MDSTNLIDTYDYDLPLNRIAEYPLANRDASKLLIYKNKTIIDGAFKTIAETVPENALLVFNNTRVVQARFLFHTATGAQIEIFSLEPAEGGPAESMSEKKTGCLEMFCRKCETMEAINVRTQCTFKKWATISF
jgi:S-adenosylmethionine:tRNA ribosyltransferase-isomerase